MIYFTLPLAALRSPQFMRATDAQVRTWLGLLSYCYDQGNSGQIEVVGEWTDEMWYAIGARPDVVKAASPLWHTNGIKITVHFYSIDMQRVYEAKRRGGVLGAAKRWEKKNRKSPDRENGTKPHHDTA